MIFAAFFAACPAGAYQVSCNNHSQTVTSISSVMGETRQDAGYSKPNRFHGGVDVTNVECKTVGNAIGAIEGGRIATTTPGCESGAACMRITTLDGSHAFDYVHVEILGSLQNGSTVQAGQQIGTVEDPAPLAPHLHLNEIQVQPLDLRINPQRFGGMLFSDADVPQFRSITVGGVSNDIILVPQYPGAGAPGDQTYAPFNYVSGTFYIAGQVAVMAGISDGVVQTRKGVYSAMPGFSVAGNFQFLSGPPNISFDTLFDGQSSTYSIHTVYFSQNNNSSTFFPTNQKINGNPYLEAWANTWDASALSGLYNVCVYSQGYPQATKYRDCTNAYIDNVRPTMIFEDSNLIPWQNQNATSSTTIVVAGNDTGSGVYTITLTGTGGFTPQTSTNTSPGPSSPAYPATFTGLTDGQTYTATVVDLAGNSAQASFIIGCDQFLVEGRV